MISAARLVVGLALCLALVASSLHPEDAAALEQGKLVAPGRLVVAGRKLSCGTDRDPACATSKASPSPPPSSC